MAIDLLEVRNRLWRAVAALACSPSTIHERLAEAYTDFLAPLGAERVPEAFRRDFLRLLERLRPAGHRSRKAQAGTAGDERARTFAKSICRLYESVNAILLDEREAHDAD